MTSARFVFGTPEPAQRVLQGIALSAAALLIVLGVGPAHAAVAAALPAGLTAAVSQTLRTLESAGSGRYTAQNPENRLMLSFDGGRLELAPALKNGGWHGRLAFQGYGAPGKIQPVPKAEAVVSGTRLEYRRGGVTEWYENKPEGLEQGFTLASPPMPGARQIELKLGVSGELRAEIEKNGRDAKLRDSQGNAVLAYRDLAVIDARGKRLLAHLVLAGQALAIRVDVRGAAWPIVVDPLITGFEAKLTAQSADGGSEAAGGTLFGVSVALSADGTTALVGADQAAVSDQSFAGAAYVYTRSGPTWKIQQKLTAQNTDGSSDAVAFAVFGVSVALSADGATALVGSWAAEASGVPNAGAAYVYTRNGAVWGIQQKLTAQKTDGGSDAADGSWFGQEVALSGDGDTALVGAYRATVSDQSEAGAAYVYARSGAVWTIQRKLLAQKTNGNKDAAVGAWFGISAALSADGTTALVGADNAAISGLSFAGAAYVFVRDGTAWNIQQKLVPQNTDGTDGAEASASFGSSVALAADGAAALIGATGATAFGQSYAGAAYVYTRNGAAWAIQERLTAQNADGSNDTKTGWFGQSVALSADGATALVGAGLATVSGVSGLADAGGAAYVYTRNGVSWGIQDKLTALNADGSSDVKTGANFGASAVLSGDGATALVGAVWATAAGVQSAGAAYAYAIAQPSPNPSPAPGYTLSVTVTGNGGVTSSPPGIDCGPVCSASFDIGSTVALTAVPAEGYKFKRWIGAGCVGKKPCAVKLNQSKAVKAKFVKRQ